MKDMSKVVQALEMARHELVTFDGLIVTGNVDAKGSFTLDTTKAILEIDTVLSELSGSGSQPSSR